MTFVDALHVRLWYFIPLIPAKRRLLYMLYSVIFQHCWLVSAYNEVHSEQRWQPVCGRRTADHRAEEIRPISPGGRLRL